MAFNIENAFLTRALAELEPQYKRLNPEFKGKLDLGFLITFLVIADGPDKGKLTIAQRVRGVFVPHPDIVPVDYENSILPGEGLAAAVRRVFYNNYAKVPTGDDQTYAGSKSL